MMNRKHRLVPIILLSLYTTSLCGCGASSSSGTLKYRPVIFHIGERTVEFTEEDNVYELGDLSQEHRRFAGWSTDETKDHIICEDNEVTKEKIKEYIYTSSKISIDLYAIYADVLDVSFVVNTNTFTSGQLDSILENTILVPEHSKDGFVFEGWSKTPNSTTIDLGDVATVSYASIAPISLLSSL